MLNCESQKYFTRALCISSSAFCYYALNPAGNLDKIQKCTKIYDRRKLIEYLKTANSSELIKCYPYHTYDYTNITWAPKIESPSAPRAFQTKHPEDIYNSCEAPAMDAMFGINNEVFLDISLFIIEIIKECFVFRKAYYLNQRYLRARNH